MSDFTPWVAGRTNGWELVVQTCRGAGHVVVGADAPRRDQLRGEGRNQGSEPRATFALIPVPRTRTSRNGTPAHPPHRLSAVLDYVAGNLEDRLSLGEYLAGLPADTARPSLNEQPFFMKPPFDLARRTGNRPLAVIFESRSCQACDEMHQQGLQRPEVRAQLPRFDIARFALNDPSEVVTPSGQRTSARLGHANWV